MVKVLWFSSGLCHLFNSIQKILHAFVISLMYRKECIKKTYGMTKRRLKMYLKANYLAKSATLEKLKKAKYSFGGGNKCK